MIFRTETLFTLNFHRFFLSVLCGVAVLCIAASAYAQVTSACDPEYMDALEARAYLEGQREIAHNKDLIAKPDSVLEYSCFHGFLEDLANDAFDMFSETDRWGAILPNTSMDTALTNLVGTALRTYLNTNFRHGYINERGTASGFAAISENNPPPSAVGGGAWPGLGAFCDHMIEAWNRARALDFQEEIPWDEFHTFEWYEGQDPRRRPIGNGVTIPTVDSRIVDAFTTAYNGAAGPPGTLPYEVANPGFTDTTPYLDDPIVTFLNLLAPGACAPPPIPTGVTVSRSGMPDYAECVCSNPGCFYTPGGMACAAGGCGT